MGPPLPPSHSHPWQPNHALRSDVPRALKAFLPRRHRQRTICHHAILHERMTRVEGRAPCHRHRESRVIDSVQFGLAGHRPSLIKATYVTAAALPSLSVGQAGGRRRFLMDLADGRTGDSRDVSLLVSLFIAPLGRRIPDTFVPKVRQVRPRSPDRYSSSISQISATILEILPSECLGDSLLPLILLKILLTFLSPLIHAKLPLDI